MNICFKSSRVFHVSGKSTLAARNLSMADTWTNYNIALLLAAQRRSIIIYNFVLMSNHYHLLVQCQTEEDLDFFIQAMQMQEDKEIEVYFKKITHFSMFIESYKYIYQNPVKAGLSFSVETYFFSSLRLILEGKNMHAFRDPLHLINDGVRVLRWLNGQNSSLFYQTKPIHKMNY